jgi:hypothetical protein
VRTACYSVGIAVGPLTSAKKFVAYTASEIADFEHHHVPVTYGNGPMERLSQEIVATASNSRISL